MKQAFLVGILAGALSVTALPATGQTGAASGQAQATAGQAEAAVVSLGTIRIPRRVQANGQELAPGRYQVRVTSEEAKPVPPGQTPRLERWAEFLQGGQVKGREVASVVPGDEIAQVAQGRPVAPGSSRVEMLKGNEFLRIWVNRGGTHYLIHLPPAS